MVFVTAAILALPANFIFAQGQAGPATKEEHAHDGLHGANMACPMMGTGGMGMGGMGGMMGGDPKTMGRMMEMRGEMMVKMGEVMMKHGKNMQGQDGR